VATADDGVTEQVDPRWLRVQESPDFARLRRTYRRFVFPMSAAFLIWYFAYVLCSAYARSFMNHKLAGNVTVGLVFGLLQFVSTFAIAVLYSRFANSKLDAEADRIRRAIEDGRI
jgi:uncharacterized membrane protein (DUF485 family)